MTPEGNFEGRTILSRVRGDEEIGRFRGLEPEDVAAAPGSGAGDAAGGAGAAAAAGARRQGHRCVEWADAGGVRGCGRGRSGRCRLPRPRADRGERYRAAAVRAGEALLTLLQGPDGRMARSWKDGRTSGQGVLEDQTHVAAGLLALYEATWDERWFVAARRIMDATLEHFADPAGGFFDTADDHEPLPARPKELQDNAAPSGNAMAATVLLGLAALTGEGRYRDAAERSLGLVSAYAARYPTGFAQWLLALDFAISHGARDRDRRRPGRPRHGSAAGAGARRVPAARGGRAHPRRGDQRDPAPA